MTERRGLTFDLEESLQAESALKRTVISNSATLSTVTVIKRKSYLMKLAHTMNINESSCMKAGSAQRERET